MDINKAAKALQLVTKEAVRSNILSDTAVRDGGWSALSTVVSLSSISIPITSSDERVRKFCKDYQLYKPENMIRFYVESFYAQFNATIDAVSNIQTENLNSVISRVDNARNYLLDALEQQNENTRREHLRDSVRESRAAIADLQLKIKNYITETRRIDDLPTWKYKLQAPQNVSRLKTLNALGKASMGSLFQAINILEAASAELGETANSVFKSYQSFMEDMIIPNSRLMHDYDEMKSAEFWLSMRQQLNANKQLALVMNDVYEDEMDIDD